MPDAVELAIMNSGHILINGFSHKWLLSQMLRHPSFNAYFIDGKPYRYEWTTALKQIKVISRVKRDEIKSYERFFNFRTIRSMLSHYLNYAEPHIGLSSEIRQIADRMKKAETYADLSKYMEKFISLAKFPDKMPKSAVWISAFKNFGAYTVMKELIMFYECRLTVFGRTLNPHESLLVLETMVNKNIDGKDGLYEMMTDFINSNNETLNVKGIAFSKNFKNVKE